MQASSDLTVPEKDKKMIRILQDTHEELNKLVQYKGETYDSIIRRLIKFYKEQHKRT
jgi:hypothetical protein